MFDWKEFDKTKQILAMAGASIYREVLGQHHLHIRPTDLGRWLEFLKEDLQYLTLVDIIGVDRSEYQGEGNFDFEVVYQLLNMGNHQRINLHVFFNEGEILPSVIEFFPHGEWMEREQKEMLNLNFGKELNALLLPKGQKVFPLKKISKDVSWPIEVPEDLPKIDKNPNKSEAPYPEEAYVWERHDIFSPLTMGNFDWWLCFDPIKTVKSQVRVGYHYQAFEKLLESKDFLQINYLVDKLHMGAAPNYSLAWVKNIEELLRIKIPERAQAIRILLLELSRIAEHLTVLYEICSSLNQDEGRYFLNAREKIYELFEKYCGHRQGYGVVRIGGLIDDLPHGWSVEYESVAAVLQKILYAVHKSLISQRNFRNLLDGDPVNAQVVLTWGVSGPSMRASGLNFDLRKSQPFYFYQDIDFDVPVGIHGTPYDRYLIRFEEILQSVRIVTQVIDNLQLGDVMNSEFKENSNFNHLMRNQEALNNWHYSGLESPNGEAGFFLLLNKNFSPYRIKIKTPSFALVQALPQFVNGFRKEQLRACLASLGIRRYEMDR